MLSTTLWDPQNKMSSQGFIYICSLAGQQQHASSPFCVGKTLLNHIGPHLLSSLPDVLPLTVALKLLQFPSGNHAITGRCGRPAHS